MSKDEYKLHIWWKSIESIVEFSDAGHSRLLVNQLLQLYNDKWVINSEFGKVDLIHEELDEIKVKQDIILDCRKRVQNRYENYSRSSTKGISMNYFDRMLRDLDYIMDGLRTDVLYLKNEIQQINYQKTINLQKKFNWSTVLVGGVSVGIAIFSLIISIISQ